MPVTTASAAAHITPVVVRTLFEHYKRKGKKLKNGDKEEDARDDIFFDEGFHIVKAFIELGTHNTIEALQAFTNTHIPAPPWAAVAPVQIPFSSCNRAADLLIDWFDPGELKNVVGGERWWQVRGLDGIDAEWITEKEFLRVPTQPRDQSKNRNSVDEAILSMDHLESVILYVHGGAFFWGSINSHRYQIIRYARKSRSRAFAVNYRKAPQYPWPCPLHDVLAAYFYLTDPPSGALHKPIPPHKLVFAGDSAGGGLCLSALTVLRDMGIELPVGAILISPWVDLTHSFPSVMDNTDSDIIPPHGFIAKPSTSWPVDPKLKPRVATTCTKQPPAPGHADMLNPDTTRIRQQREVLSSIEENVSSQATMLAEVASDQHFEFEHIHNSSVAHGWESAMDIGPSNEDMEDLIDRWQPKPPKVLMENPDDTPLELRSQIQPYATTEQLTHPLVSPIIQGSLGNLCPLYILAGDGEVLRDEIIYTAHKAAHPDQYPAREGVLRYNNRQRRNAKEFTTPTKVHLQVFDGMCHVLTVFVYTDSAKYAYRSIARFVKHVTQDSNGDISTSPFPQPMQKSVADDDVDDPEISRMRGSMRNKKHKSEKKKIGTTAVRSDTAVRGGVMLYKEDTKITAQVIQDDQTPGMVSEVENSQGFAIDQTGDVIIIRERVNIHGKVRPMEPEDQIEALQIPPGQVCIIKEAPTRRWLAGQEKWDKKYSRTADKVIKKRRRIEAKAALLLANARQRGLMLVHELEGDGNPEPLSRNGNNLSATRRKSGIIDVDRRWGPLDLDAERPPPTAIANRRDTPEALALLKKTIYHTAPVTHNTVPKRKKTDMIIAIFDPNDHPVKPPPQSVSERQVKTHMTPVHGMKIWDVLVAYFMRKKENGTKHVVAAVSNAAEKINPPIHNSRNPQ